MKRLISKLLGIDRRKFKRYIVKEAWPILLCQNPPEEVILGGGGANNPVLVRMLEQRLAPSRVTTHEAVGLSSDAKEAIAFAVLAYETVHGRTGNLTTCTGAASRAVLGKIVPGSNFGELTRTP